MRHRLQFAANKLVRMALLLLGVSLAAFLLMDASPLDPLQTNLGQAALGSLSPEQLARLREYWGVVMTRSSRQVPAARMASSSALMAVSADFMCGASFI